MKKYDNCRIIDKTVAFTEYEDGLELNIDIDYVNEKDVHTTNQKIFIPNNSIGIIVDAIRTH